MICFALLAHQNERALFQQIENIRTYNGGNVKIVFYNGGKDPHFGKKVCQLTNVMYCPYSRPLEWGKLARFHYDVMRWLEDKQIRYDYLAILDYDVLFVREGLERFLNNNMAGYDCMMPLLRRETDRKKTTWKPGQTMWKEWYRWRPFFRSNHFYGTFNPMQIYRHGIIRRMLVRLNKPRLNWLLRNTQVFALEEILYITLAMCCGGKCKEYPKDMTTYLRVYPRINLEEAKRAERDPKVLFMHPVKGPMVWRWVCRSSRFR